jgi:hypothetical protein
MEISITLIIIIATSIISFIAFSNHNLMDQFIFYPQPFVADRYIVFLVAD